MIFPGSLGVWNCYQNKPNGPAIWPSAGHQKWLTIFTEARKTKFLCFELTPTSSLQPIYPRPPGKPTGMAALSLLKPTTTNHTRLQWCITNRSTHSRRQSLHITWGTLLSSDLTSLGHSGSAHTILISIDFNGPITLFSVYFGFPTLKGLWWLIYITFQPFCLLWVQPKIQNKPESQY